MRKKRSFLDNVNIEEGSGQFDFISSTFSPPSITSTLSIITASTKTAQFENTSIYSTLSNVITSKLQKSTLYQLTTPLVNNSCNENYQCIKRYGPSVCINNMCSCIPPTIFFNQSCLSNIMSNSVR